MNASTELQQTLADIDKDIATTEKQAAAQTDAAELGRLGGLAQGLKLKRMAIEARRSEAIGLQAAKERAARRTGGRGRTGSLPDTSGRPRTPVGRTHDRLRRRRRRSGGVLDTLSDHLGSVVQGLRRSAAFGPEPGRLQRRQSIRGGGGSTAGHRHAGLAWQISRSGRAPKC